MMEERDDLRKQDPASLRLTTMNDEISKATSNHKRRQWRQFVESIDHRTDSTKLWRTIKGINGKSKQTADNEGITFTGRPHTSPTLIANSFNRQFTSSKLGKHSSSRRTRQVSKDVKRMSLEEAESFTSAIKSCRNSRAYGQDSLSIFHLKNLRALATEHLKVKSLYNDSLKSCGLPSIWKTSLVNRFPGPARTHRKAPPTDLSRCYAHQPRSSRRSSYSRSMNLSHRLKINTASDPDTRLHLPSSSSQPTSRQASTSGNHLTVKCVWP